MATKRDVLDPWDRTNALLEAMHETLKEIRERLPKSVSSAPSSRPALSPDRKTSLRNSALELLSMRHPQEFRELLKKLTEDEELGVFKSGP